MADKTVTVKSSGGDYASLNAALSGESANLVTAQCLLTIECYSMQDVTAADTGTGYTTNSSYYIKVITPTAERHNGKWNASKYRLEVTKDGDSGACLKIQEDYTQTIGLQVELNNTSSNTQRGIWLRNANQSEITHTIVKGYNGTGGAGSGNRYGIHVETYSDTCTFTLINDIAYDFVKASNGGRGITEYRGGTGGGITLNAYNVTTHNCTTGFNQNNQTFNAYNCGAADSGENGFNGTISQTTCSSTTPTFVDKDNDDFHLAFNDSTWKDQGTDESGIFTDDIDGETRSGTWDIGADEYIAAGGKSSRNTRSFPLGVRHAMPFRM